MHSLVDPAGESLPFAGLALAIWRKPVVTQSPRFLPVGDIPAVWQEPSP